MEAQARQGFICGCVIVSTGGVQVQRHPATFDMTDTAFRNQRAVAVSLRGIFPLGKTYVFEDKWIQFCVDMDKAL